MAIPEFVLQSLLDQVFTFLAERGRGYGRDVITREKIKEAIKNAAKRFENEYPNQELAKALNNNTRFHDLESIRQSIRHLLEHPFDPVPQVQVEAQFTSVLPKRYHKEVGKAADFFIERLQEELMAIEKLQRTLSLIYIKRAAEASERTARGIDQLVARQKITSFEIDEARRAYLKYIIDTNQYIDPRGIMQTRRSVSLKLDEVYITLNAERGTRTLDFDRFLEPMRGEEEDFQYQVEDFVDKEISNWAGRRLETVDLAHAIRENIRMVVLGEPGAGKTILTRFLALQFSGAILENKVDVKDKDGHNYGSPRLPILVRIANYADAFSRNHNLALRAFILDSFGDVPVPREPLQMSLQTALDGGNALVLLDGLDEIVDVGDRVEIGRRIEQFVAACHLKTRCMITSRIAGYRIAPLAGDYTHFTLREMESTQIEKFLRKWCPAAEKAQNPKPRKPRLIRGLSSRYEVFSKL